MLQCPLCTKTFKSRSGLRRHSNREHPVDEMKAQSHEEPVADDQDARSKSDDDDAMIKACKALAIKPANVMSYRVYPDKVVIIEGPTGWKRVWRPGEE